MDEMNIKSKFMRNVISKLVKKIIRNKFGYDVDVELNELNVTITDGKAHIHMSADAEIDKEELIKIMKKNDLD